MSTVFFYDLSILLSIQQVITELNILNFLVHPNSTDLYISTRLFQLLRKSVCHQFSQFFLNENFSENVLGIGDATWSNFGYPRWQLVLCLALGWIIAFFCLIKGIKSAGYVIYFTALFPYVILTALLVNIESMSKMMMISPLR